MRAPAHIRQLDGSAWAGSACMGAVGAMALDAFTDGAARPTMHQIRAAQDDQSGGIGLDDVRQAWSRGWGLTFSTSPRSWAAVTSRLRAGQGVAVTVMYAALAGYRAPGSRFLYGHALYLSGLDAAGMVTAHDPLRSGPTKIPELVVRTAWTGGSGYGTGSNVPRGASSAGAPDSTGAPDGRARALALLDKAGVPSSPDSYVFTRADADKIATNAYGYSDASAGVGRKISDTWTGQTVAAWVAASATTGDAYAASPLAPIADALRDLPTTLARTGILLGLVGLLVVGVVLTFRESSVVAIPSPLRGSARA